MVQPNSLIQLTDVSFSYNDGRDVFDNLSFSFGPKDRAGLIGPNGSGKTTLFQIIMGLAAPRAGQIEIFGRERRREDDFLEVREKIGFVFQDADDQLFCPTVAEDVAFGPLNLGVDHLEVRARVKEALALLSLQGFENRVTYKLSGGEKKLVSLATVLSMKPQMLLLDEPTAGLDENATACIVNTLRRLDLPYLIISHDRDFLNSTTDFLYRMDQGAMSRISSQQSI